MRKKRIKQLRKLCLRGRKSVSEEIGRKRLVSERRRKRT